MQRPFVYGMAVGGDNFTDRENERRRLKLDFRNGVNVLLLSPRRMGKTSLVRQAISEIKADGDEDVIPIYMDIYDCRSEYDLLSRYATAIFKATNNKVEQLIASVGQMLSRITPKISYSLVPDQEISIGINIKPTDYTPEEVLCLPDKIAKERRVRIVICIDEFQQIGEMPDSIGVQKRLRGAWQHMENVSFCLFGSKKHMMERMFQSKRMPFYMFGEMMHLGPIPTDDWVSFISSRFAMSGKIISPDIAEHICDTVGNYSTYVQQLSWNVLAETKGEEVTKSDLAAGIEALLLQCDSLFTEQTAGLTTYQMNFLRALCNDVDDNFTSREVAEEYNLGTKSNITRIKDALINRELIETEVDPTTGKSRIHLCDKVFSLWLKKKLSL